MLSMEVIKTSIFFLILLYASVKDIKTREVPDYLPIMICITALIDNSVQNIPYMIIGAILIPIPQIVIAARNPGTYGGADIKIVAAFTFYLGIKGGSIILILGLSISLIFQLLLCKNKNGIALMPYFLVGCIIYFSLLFFI